MVESELFGQRKGAYTGAENRLGYFRAANGGTLFLDELSLLHGAQQLHLGFERELSDGARERPGIAAAKFASFSERCVQLALATIV